MPMNEEQSSSLSSCRNQEEGEQLLNCFNYYSQQHTNNDPSSLNNNSNHNANNDNDNDSPMNGNGANSSSSTTTFLIECIHQLRQGMERLTQKNNELDQQLASVSDRLNQEVLQRRKLDHCVEELVQRLSPFLQQDQFSSGPLSIAASIVSTRGAVTTDDDDDDDLMDLDLICQQQHQGDDGVQAVARNLASSHQDCHLVDVGSGERRRDEAATIIASSPNKNISGCDCPSRKRRDEIGVVLPTTPLSSSSCKNSIEIKATSNPASSSSSLPPSPFKRKRQTTTPSKEKEGDYPIPAKLPTDLVTLYNHWNENNLGIYASKYKNNQSNFLEDADVVKPFSAQLSSTQRHRFGKRKYLVDKIQDKARREKISEVEAAHLMDLQRDSLNQSVDAYRLWLKSVDPTTVKRQSLGG